MRQSSFLDHLAVTRRAGAGHEKVMTDPRLQPDTNTMPFDAKRLIYGGFEMVVEA